MYIQRKQKYKDSSKLHRVAWKLKSKLVRLEGSKNGADRCFTCNIYKDIKELDAGHYIHGDRFDFTKNNIHKQCSRCNRFLHGNLGVYALRLIETYGLTAYKELEALRFRERHYTIKELEELIAYFKQELKKYD